MLLFLVFNLQPLIIPVSPPLLSADTVINVAAVEPEFKLVSDE